MMKNEKGSGHANKQGKKKPLYNINQERLLSTIEISADYGKLPNGGLCRLALSEEDRQIRNLFMDWMRECHLAVRIDDVGNMYGRRQGTNSDALPVVIGSHLDTQQIGGKYDGILGVMGALEIVRTLNDCKIETERPIEIVNFTNEEGARFLPSMLGSGVVADSIRTENLKMIEDKDQLRFLDELEKIGYKGSAANKLRDIYCYLELHIEQGPILESNKRSIGAVTGIQGISTFEVVVSGKTSHAGTTPMENRIDAMLSAAKMIQGVYKLSENDPKLLITIGKIQAFPNVTNSIADKVIFSIDIRHPEDNVRNLFTNELKERLSTMAFIENIDIYIKNIIDVKTEKFATDIVNEIQLTSDKFGYSSMRLMSGAGHDAKYMNKLAPSGMIFIPSMGGISHSEEEFSTNEDIVKGAQILFELVLRFANRKDELKR